MYAPFIYPLIPRPIQVETGSVRGELFIEGNLEHNYVRFRFCFTEPKDVAPLAVLVRVEGAEYVYNCTIRDYEKNEVKTAVFHPNFFVGQQFAVTGIEPLVKFEKKEEKVYD